MSEWVSAICLPSIMVVKPDSIALVGNSSAESVCSFERLSSYRSPGGGAVKRAREGGRERGCEEEEVGGGGQEEERGR